jgi:hypothetical protein
VYPIRKSSFAVLAAAIVAMLATGCSNQSIIQSPKGSAGADTARFDPIRDIPIPTGSTLDNDRSLILSNEKEWTGRLVMKADPSMPQLFSYYVKQMPGFGWQPVASIMAETSVLTYVQGQRAATVQIKPAMLQGSIVTVTMAPRHSADTMSSQALTPDQSVQSDSLPPIGARTR